MSSRKHRHGRWSASTSGRAHHKSLQLCAQVAEALHAALAGECRDAVLQDLTVVSVTPAAGGSHLVVTVELPVGDEGVTREIALHRLECAAGMLRCAVGAAISRRRVPELAFHVVPGEPGRGAPAPDGELPP